MWEVTALWLINIQSSHVQWFTIAGPETEWNGRRLKYYFVLLSTRVSKGKNNRQLVVSGTEIAIGIYIDMSCLIGRKFGDRSWHITSDTE